MPGYYPEGVRECGKCGYVVGPGHHCHPEDYAECGLCGNIYEKGRGDDGICKKCREIEDNA